MFSTKERLEVLVRLRRKRAHFIRTKPHWYTAIQDTAIQIDALEALVTIDIKGGKNAKEKDKEKKTDA